jgi:hypothetical protein
MSSSFAQSGRSFARSSGSGASPATPAPDNTHHTKQMTGLLSGAAIQCLTQPKLETGLPLVDLALVGHLFTGR